MIPNARTLALVIAHEAIAAVLPGALVPRFLTLKEGRLRIADRRIPVPEGVWVLGAGKASVGMAAAAEQVLGAAIRGGIVITVPGAVGPQPQRVEVLEGEHPVPGEASLASTRRLLQEAGRVPTDDVVLWLISGGASALLCAPAEGITLAEKQEATRLLVLGGATIDEMNCVRKHLSAVKGGQLARLLAPATVVTLALSDVVSGRPDVIGSGPTVPDDSTFAEALQVVDGYGLRDRMPSAVLQRFDLGALGRIEETPRAGDPCFTGAVFEVIGSPATAAAAAAKAAREHGLAATIWTDQMTGEAQDVARALGKAIRELRGLGVLIAAGETTVTVTGQARAPILHAPMPGRGGRCQELAAALIPEIEGLECAVACAATDGQDYLPGVGGAVVDGATAARVRTLGLSVEQALAAHDTFPLHQALNTLVESEPTGTNVCDLIVAVVG